jgi:hypothetical protein
MVKRGTVLIYAVCLFAASAFFSCSHDGEGGGGQPPEIVRPADNTSIIFDNTNGICPVLVYSSARRDADSFVTEAEQGASSAPVPYPASQDGWTFYYSWKTFIDDVPLAYTPQAPEGVQHTGHIDAGQQNRVTVPAVDTILASVNTPLTSDSYIVIQNESVFAFCLVKGSSVLKPENYSAAQNDASNFVNSGEKAVYKHTGGSSALYKLSINGSDIPLESIPDLSFAAGHIYAIVLRGQNAATLAPALESDKAITLANVSMAQGANKQFSFTTWRDTKPDAEIPGDNTLEFYANSVKLSGGYWQRPDGGYDYSGQILESEYKTPGTNYPDGALVIWTKKTEHLGFVLRRISENDTVILQNGTVLFYKQ